MLSRKERSFSSAEECMTIMLQFLEQYYQLYDSDNREPLVNAYHEDAVLSVGSEFHYFS
jgi:nuclear RNA export factor